MEAKTFRITLSGNDPVNNAYCRIASIIQYYIKEELDTQIIYAIKYFIKTYKFLPNMTETMGEEDKIPKAEELMSFLQRGEIEFKEFLDMFRKPQFKKSLEESVHKYYVMSNATLDDIIPTTTKACTCGESRYCTCKTIEVIEYKDPKTQMLAEEAKIKSENQILIDKIISIKALATTLAFSLDFEIYDKKATLTKGGMSVIFRYSNLSEALDEIQDFLENDGNV